MSWPLSQDYNEALQSPERSFADDDLRRGRASTNALGIPIPCSGNFADVYQVRGPDGRNWAVKCFTREAPGLRDRYREVSQHLRQARLPFTLDFTYLEEGVRVAGRWYPVLKMQWVAGPTLNQFAARAADKPALLDALLLIWARMGQHLRAVQVAHGDLQHGNVLLAREDNSLALKLVDYDGMWVPALAGRSSGEMGHSAYQHPRRAREQAYGPEMDRFPILLVATALCALRAGGRPLWEKYDRGDNLLFTQQDLEAPSKSRLFYDMLRSDDATVRVLASSLIDAARKPLDEVPLLAEVMPEFCVPLRAEIVETLHEAPRPAAAASSPLPAVVMHTLQESLRLSRPAIRRPVPRRRATGGRLVKPLIVTVVALVVANALLCGLVGAVYFARRGDVTTDSRRATESARPASGRR
jgi:hypothetical protein